MSIETVVVLPGSFWQIPIIQKSKAMGYRTLVINPYENSPAFPYADGHLQCDIFDIEKVMRYCISEKVDGIISDECDIAMPLIAELGQLLSLPTLNMESAHLFTDKLAMRDFCVEHGIPYPEYRLCRTIKEAEDFFENLHCRIIIKPLDSNSSRGVFLIYSKADIQKYFEKTLSYSKIQKAVLAERYIEGPEFTVDGIKTPDRHFSLAISEKKHFSHNPNIACELYFTSCNKRYNYDILAQQNDLFVNNSPLQFGLTHAEYKFENGNFYLIEIAARGGGNLISSHIVPFLSGADNYQYLLECCRGHTASPDFTVPACYKERSAVLCFFDVPENEGIVDRIEGLEILDTNPQIIEYKFNLNLGDRIQAATTDAERIGFYIACCDTRDQLDDLMELIKRNVRVVFHENDRKGYINENLYIEKSGGYTTGSI